MTRAVIEAHKVFKPIEPEITEYGIVVSQHLPHAAQSQRQTISLDVYADRRRSIGLLGRRTTHVVAHKSVGRAKLKIAAEMS
jgi:hypothetical protein